MFDAKFSTGKWTIMSMPKVEVWYDVLEQSLFRFKISDVKDSLHHQYKTQQILWMINLNRIFWWNLFLLLIYLIFSLSDSPSDFSVETEWHQSTVQLFQPCVLYVISFSLTLSHRESIFPLSPFLPAWFCWTTSFYKWLTLSISMYLTVNLL